MSNPFNISLIPLYLELFFTFVVFSKLFKVDRGMTLLNTLSLVAWRRRNHSITVLDQDKTFSLSQKKSIGASNKSTTRTTTLMGAEVGNKAIDSIRFGSCICMSTKQDRILQYCIAVKFNQIMTKSLCIQSSSRTQWQVGALNSQKKLW